MLENNIYSESKALFLQELEAGNVPEDAVAYIEDTKEIYTHGTYFASGDDYVSQADFNSTYGIIQESFNAKQDLLKSGENIKTINGESLLGEGDIVISGGSGNSGNIMEEVTYSELVNLRDNSQLIPGMQYRIIDYNTTTQQQHTMTSGHQFDIIVIADNENTLNENARSLQHENDTYFSDCNLAAWELKYTIDNDTTKHLWASSGGTGVIYYMKDEHENECPFDFKNILVKKLDPKGNPINDDWYPVFGNPNSDANSVIDDSLHGSSFKNIINVYKSFRDYSQILNRITMGSGCYNNIFGLGCHEIYIGNDSYYNHFKETCYSITLGANCDRNEFGSTNYSIILGDLCSGNKIYDLCSSIELGESCNRNIFGYNVKVITMGTNCNCNTFGSDCHRIQFVDSNNSIIPFWRYNKFESGCNNISCIDDSNSASFDIQAQNYVFTSGLTNVSVPVKRNQNVETTVAFDSIGDLKVFCKADLTTYIIYIPNESSMPETPVEGVLYLIGEE